MLGIIRSHSRIVHEVASSRTLRPTYAEADPVMTAAEQSNEQQTERADRRLVAGRYRLNARIGRGRIGDIYEADDEQHRDVDTGRRVAIQLLPGKIAQNRPLFSKLKSGYAEIRAAAHPNIVSYFDVEHDGRHGYLAMDYLDGASLRFVLKYF